VRADGYQLLERTCAAVSNQLAADRERTFELPRRALLEGGQERLHPPVIANSSGTPPGQVTAVRQDAACASAVAHAWDSGSGHLLPLPLPVG